MRIRVGKWFRSILSKTKASNSALEEVARRSGELDLGIEAGISDGNNGSPSPSIALDHNKPTSRHGSDANLPIQSTADLSGAPHHSRDDQQSSNFCPTNVPQEPASQLDVSSPLELCDGRAGSQQSLVSQPDSSLCSSSAPEERENLELERERTRLGLVNRRVAAVTHTLRPGVQASLAPARTSDLLGSRDIVWSDYGASVANAQLKNLSTGASYRSLSEAWTHGFQTGMESMA